MAELFCHTLFRYRDAKKFRAHSFVVMPNHFHLILTVAEGLTLERAMQLIKGGFSREAGRRLGARYEIWQKSFVDRRVRDAVELARYTAYIQENPVRAGLVGVAGEYRYSSLNPAFIMDEIGYPLDSPDPYRLWFRIAFACSLVNSFPLKLFPCFPAFDVFCFRHI